MSEGLAAGGAGQGRDGLAVHQVGHAAIDGDATQQAPADVAVGHDADQAAVAIHHHDRLAAVLGDGLEGLANGGGVGHAQRGV
jgi:hypothetical protein